MNFRGINSVLNSQGLKSESSTVISSGSETFSKRKSTARSSNSSSYSWMPKFWFWKTIFVSCSSYKPPPQTFDHQKFKKEGFYAWIYGKLLPQRKRNSRGVVFPYICSVKSFQSVEDDKTKEATNSKTIANWNILLIK